MKQENVRATVTDNSAVQSCKKKINQNYLTLSPYNLTTVIHIIGVCVCIPTVVIIMFIATFVGVIVLL